MSREDTLREQGNAHFKNKDYVKAIQCYREGLAINPTNWILNNNIAQAFLANKNYDDAEAHAVVSVALQQNSVKSYYRAAKAAYHLNRTGRALSYVRKGLSVCPNSDDLKALLDQLKHMENGTTDSTNERTHKTEEKNSNNSKEKSKKQAKADRSRSTSRVSSSSSSIDPNETKSSSPSVRPNKTENDTKSKKKTKGNKGPIEIEDIQNDKVLETAELIVEEQKASKSVPDKQESFENIRKELIEFMKDGSEALEKGLSRRASESYKSAIDIIVIHNYMIFGLKELDYVVLRYCLSISYIETASYNDIIKSLEYLGDIEEKHSAKLPAVYYALGNAYCKLNRFRIALDHLDKGMRVIEKGFKITTHPWPGTMNIIKETTKTGLQESLEGLINFCKTYREPDATCRFVKCLDIGNHIVPSEFIFYSDPDYIGYVVVICEANCKITYHINCWKAFKESLSEYPKLSEKDILGRPCLTSDCVNENNDPSVIVKIEIYGDDGNVKSSCSKEPVRAVNNIIKDNKKEKRKKEKTTEIIPQVKKIKSRKLKKTESVNIRNKEASTTSISGIDIRLKKLDIIRKMSYGHPLEAMFNPHLEYFGHSDLVSLEKYLTPEYVGDSEDVKNRKEFIFTYFFEYIKNEGPQRMSNIEEKWRDEASQFPGVSEFMSENEGICNFLLQSYRFAQLDEFLCVASQLPIAFDLVQEVMTEGVSFMLQDKSKLEGAKCPLVEPKATAFPSPQEPVVEEDNISMPLSEEPEEPNLEYEEEEPDLSDEPQEMFCSDFETDDDNELDDDGEDDDQDDKLELSDDKSESSVVSAVNHEADSKLDSGLNLDGDLDLDTDLNPDAEEFQPSSVEVSEVGKLYDLLQNLTNSSPFNGHGKEEFVQYVTHYFTEQAESSSPLNPAASTHTEHSDDVQEIPMVEPAPTVEMETQTEPGRNFEEEIEKLSTELKELHQSFESESKSNVALQEKYVKETAKYQESIKSYEEKILKLQNEKLKEIKSLQSEILKRDTKIEGLKKKHAEQVDKLNKLLDEGNKVKEEMESQVQDFKVKIASLYTRLEEEERREKDTLRQLLDTKKALGEQRINAYMVKCADNLKTMKNMLKYLSDDSTPTLRDVNDAIKQWEGVQRQAEMISAQFQIQYSVLSEQLKTSGNLNGTKDLALTELPTEPPNPVEDVETILKEALEKRNAHSPPHLVSGGGDATMHVNRNSSVPAPSPLLPTPTRGYMHQVPGHKQVQGSNLYMATAPYRYGSSYPTGAFGVGGTPYRPRMTVSQTPQPLMMVQTQIPMQGFVSNGYLPEQNGNFHNIAPRPLLDPAEARRSPKPFLDPTEDGLKSRPTPKPLLDPPEGALKSVPIEVKNAEAPKQPTPPPLLSSKPVPAADSTVAKLAEKKKLSAVAGLTPIERKVPAASAAPSEPSKKLGAVPKTLHKPVTSDTKNTTAASSKTWKYEKLLHSLKNHFRTEDPDELCVCLAIARERNNNSLSGLTVPAIFEMVSKVLQERSETMINSGSMAMDKFGGCPWGSVKEPDFEWNKPVVEDFEECIICHILMTTGVTPLQCKHSFHTECIRKWLKTNSTCPVCRKYTTLNDEFPPLA